MVLEMERTAENTAATTVCPQSKKRLPWREMIVGAGAMIVVALYLLSNNAKEEAYQLEFSITSEVPFKEELPRTAYLVVLNQDGTIETFEDKRFASGFVDRRSNFRFSIPSPSPKRIFFSPAPTDQFVEITGVRAMRITERKLSQVPLDQLVPHRQVEVISRAPNSLSLRTLPGNQIPTLELKLDTLDFPTVKPSSAPRILLVLGFASIATWLLLMFFRGRIFVSHAGGTSAFRIAQFGAAAALILTMATITKFNAHPDEYLHFEAAKYFVTHWFFPAFDDPAVEPSYSHYGVSYLQDLDTAYFFIGKLLAVIPVWFTSAETMARLCNVLLFAVLTGWLIRRLPKSLAPAIFLISPQVWYVFAYVNGDAWVLALSFAIIVQLADKDSLLGQYLNADGWRTAYRGALWFAALLALLLMAKRNYYLFLPFIGLVAFWRTFLWEPKREPLRAAKKWAAIFICAATFYLPFRIGHEAINHFESSRLRVEQAEKHAAPQFRPSEIADGKGAQRLNLRHQGIPYTDLFVEYNWAAQSFQSFCGVYQWMSLNGPLEYYFVMGALYATLLAFLIASICRLSWLDALFALSVLGLASFVVLISAYHSWTLDFQPQGRYLFPILPMIAFLFHWYRESLRSRVFNLLFACLFACSVYSFVFVGLKNIPK